MGPLHYSVVYLMTLTATRQAATFDVARHAIHTVDYLESPISSSDTHFRSYALYVDLASALYNIIYTCITHMHRHVYNYILYLLNTSEWNVGSITYTIYAYVYC